MIIDAIPTRATILKCHNIHCNNNEIIKLLTVMKLYGLGSV